jgi:multiple sugar transport system substrate-binding protein
MISRRQALAGLGGAAVYGCASASKANTLQVWAMGREGEVLRDLLPGFVAQHQGLKVEVQQLPWTSAHSKLLTAFAGDTLPDVAQLGNTWIPELHAVGALTPLDDLARGQAGGAAAIDKPDYFPGIWSTNLISGALYGIPWYVDTRLLFYRTDILHAAGVPSVPVDWAGWSQAMRKVKAHVGKDRYAVLLPLNEFEQLEAFFLQQRAPMLVDNLTRANFSHPELVGVLAFYRSLFDQGLAPVVTAQDVANVWNEFGKGWFSFYIAGPWNIGEFRRRLPREQQASWSTAPLPGPHGPGVSTAGGASLVIFRKSPRKALAWALIEHLSRPEVQAKFNALTGDLAPRRSAWPLARLDADPVTAAFKDQLERVAPAPPVPEWERIAAEIRIVSEAMIRGHIDPKAAAADLDRRVNTILEKRRWLVSQGLAR